MFIYFGQWSLPMYTAATTVKQNSRGKKIIAHYLLPHSTCQKQAMCQYSNNVLNPVNNKID